LNPFHEAFVVVFTVFQRTCRISQITCKKVFRKRSKLRF